MMFKRKRDWLFIEKKDDWNFFLRLAIFNGDVVDILVIKVLRQKEVCSQILVLLTGKISLYH